MSFESLNLSFLIEIYFTLKTRKSFTLKVDLKIRGLRIFKDMEALAEYIDHKSSTSSKLVSLEKSNLSNFEVISFHMKKLEKHQL